MAQPLRPRHLVLTLGLLAALLVPLTMSGGVVAQDDGGRILRSHQRAFPSVLDPHQLGFTDDIAVVSVIGPAATELALAGPLGPEHAHREITVGTVAATAVASDGGVDLFVAAADAADVRDSLHERGVVAVSEAAAEIVRVEGGRPRFGHEMTSATLPAEAGINERAVSFTKGCYIGQETVARLHYKGKPNRYLRGLRLALPVADGDSVLLGERELGTIGTAVVSPAHGPIALAVLRREAEPGMGVSVGPGVEAEVLEPGFERRPRRPQSE